jgi:hypothetical protein
VLPGLLLAFTGNVTAQTQDIGIQLNVIRLHNLNEAPFGIGGRWTHRVASVFAIDTELTHYPENPSGNFGETTALFGIRAGKRFERNAIFAKARPGVIHFGGEYFRLRLDPKTHFTMDVGAVLEYYRGRRTVVRIDVGDAIIVYGAARLFDRLNPDALGTVHNFQVGFGLGVRF